MLKRINRATLIVAFMTMAACSQPAERGTSTVADKGGELEPRTGPASFLALGDSYTIGESVASDQRWPVMLARRLRSSGIEIQKPRIIAETGWTTDELREAIEAAELEPPYDLVTLLIGVNDQYRGRGAPHYRGEFEGLLERAVRLAGGAPSRVIVVSIPDWGVTPFARKDERGAGQIAEEIAAYNAVNREITEQHGAHYVNVTDISKEVADDILLVANDGLHPSAQQYRRWTDRILPVAREILGDG